MGELRNGYSVNFFIMLNILKNNYSVAAFVFVAAIFALISYRYVNVLGERNEIEKQKLVMEGVEKSTSQENLVTQVSSFDQQVEDNRLERKCQSEANAAFNRDRLPGYGWQAHWNKKLKVCISETTGWDTEIKGTWNDMLWDVGGEESLGSLTIYNSAVANGTQKKDEYIPENQTVKICVMRDEVECSSVKEWSAYKDALMTE
jgi:hypothetical protein